MKTKLAIILPILIFLPQCVAPLTGAMGMPMEGILSADYKDGEQVRVASGDMQEVPFQIAFDRVVEMVEAKQYSRFALIRNKCETSRLLSTGTNLGTTCILWAQMLAEGAVAEPMGSDDEVVYYSISGAGNASLE